MSQEEGGAERPHGPILPVREAAVTDPRRAARGALPEGDVARHLVGFETESTVAQRGQIEAAKRLRPIVGGLGGALATAARGAILLGGRGQRHIPKPRPRGIPGRKPARHVDENHRRMIATVAGQDVALQIRHQRRGVGRVRIQAFECGEGRAVHRSSAESTHRTAPVPAGSAHAGASASGTRAAKEPNHVHAP